VPTAEASVADANAPSNPDAAAINADSSIDASSRDASSTADSGAPAVDAADPADAADAGPKGKLMLDVKHLFMAPGDTDLALVLLAETSDGAADNVRVQVSAPDVVTATLNGEKIDVTAQADGHATIEVVSDTGARASFEVDVSAPRAINVKNQFQVGYVNQFELAYSDGGTGCEDDGTFWKPKAVPGFSPLGVYGEPGYDDPSGHAYALVARAINGSDAIRSVDQTTLLMSKRGVSVWRPLPPEGYVALSDILLPDATTDLSSYALVRQELTRPGVTQGAFWTCPGLDGYLETQRIAAKGPLEHGEIPLISSLTAAGVQPLLGDSIPNDPVLNVLVADVSVAREYDFGAAGVPHTTTLDNPSATEPKRVRAILVPFNTVADSSYDDAWKVANSPWYRLERRDYYQPVLHRVNLGSTDLEQSLSYTVGVTEAASETFTESTSVTVSAEFGVALGGLSAGGSISVTRELGYEHSMSTETFEQHMLSETIVVPPQTAMTVWQLETRIVLLRHRAGKWEPVGDPDGLVSGVDSLVFTQALAD